MFVLTPSGHSTCSLSLLSCNKNTTSTNKALNIKKAKTDLFRNSIKSRAIRFYPFEKRKKNILIIVYIDLPLVLIRHK